MFKPQVDEKRLNKGSHFHDYIAKKIKNKLLNHPSQTEFTVAKLCKIVHEVLVVHKDIPL